MLNAFQDNSVDVFPTVAAAFSSFFTVLASVSSMKFPIICCWSSGSSYFLDFAYSITGSAVLKGKVVKSNG